MKRSLHIGINDYPGTGNDLSGCINDANDWREAIEIRGFEGTSLLDGEASKSNMVEATSKIEPELGDAGAFVALFRVHGPFLSNEWTWGRPFVN